MEKLHPSRESGREREREEREREREGERRGGGEGGEISCSLAGQRRR